MKIDSIISDLLWRYSKKGTVKRRWENQIPKIRADRKRRCDIVLLRSTAKEELTSRKNELTAREKNGCGGIQHVNDIIELEEINKALKLVR